MTDEEIFALASEARADRKTRARSMLGVRIWGAAAKCDAMTDAPEMDAAPPSRTREHITDIFDRLLPRVSGAA